MNIPSEIGRQHDLPTARRQRTALLSGPSRLLARGASTGAPDPLDRTAMDCLSGWPARGPLRCKPRHSRHDERAVPSSLLTGSYDLFKSGGFGSPFFAHPADAVVNLLNMPANHAFSAMSQKKRLISAGLRGVCHAFSENVTPFVTKKTADSCPFSIYISKCHEIYIYITP